MDPTQDATNLVVNQTTLLAIEGTKMLLTLAGKGAVRLAAIITALAKEQHRTHGAVRLVNMIRSGSNLEVFTLPQDQLQTWAAAAKQYNILYTVIQTKAQDGMVDLFVRAEDAPRINRIVERFGIGLLPEASITSEPAPEQEFGQNDPTAACSTLEQETDQILQEILAASEPEKDDVADTISEVLEPDVSEEEFRALFDDAAPGDGQMDWEDTPSPQNALPGDLSETSSNRNLTEDRISNERSKTSSPTQGNEWTFKRVRDEWPLLHPRSEFDADQRRQIHKGFEAGLSVEQINRYAKPEYPAETMESMRSEMRPSVREAINRIRAERVQDTQSQLLEHAEKLVTAGKEL